MTRTYVVVVTTEDYDEFRYPFTTTRGAFAAIERAMRAHHEAGHMLSDVLSVSCEQGLATRDEVTS